MAQTKTSLPNISVHPSTTHTKVGSPLVIQKGIRKMRHFTVVEEELNSLGLFGYITAIFGSITGIIASLGFGVYWDWITMGADQKVLLEGVTDLIKWMLIISGSVSLAITLYFGNLTASRIKKIKSEHYFLEISGD